MPTHYAASELLIVLVALWTARALWRQNMGHAALGTLLFGTAAALGAVKFGLGVRHESFIALHQLASQFGAAWLENGCQLGTTATTKGKQMALRVL